MKRGLAFPGERAGWAGDVEKVPSWRAVLCKAGGIGNPARSRVVVYYGTVLLLLLLHAGMLDDDVRLIFPVADCRAGVVLLVVICTAI